MSSCDLCGATKCETVVDVPARRALRSDRTVVDDRLWKVSCEVCGLVRNGAAGARFLDAYYRDEYEVAAPDHRFYTPRGPVERSTLMANWIAEALDSAGIDRNRVETVLEIGAGAGAVVAEISRRLPNARCRGFELSESASRLARANGIEVVSGSRSDLPSNAFDLVYAVAVLEHVPAPTAFLDEARRVLKPGGHLVLIQPTQDVPSYDILFVDHVHHFGTPHLTSYAEKSGFRERFVAVGYECMPNFSLHAWQSTAKPSAWRWAGPAAETTCATTARHVIDDMRQLDAEARRLVEAGRPFAAFGLNEVFALARAYSCFEEHGIRCGLDDEPGKSEYQRLGFPVVTPERCLEFGVQDVFLTMNRIYYEQATTRLGRLGVVAHPVLS